MAKRDHAGANNTCRQCGLSNKARDGHMPREGPFAAMRACGWCPERQEFSVRSASSDKRGAGLRLRLLEQHLLTVDSEGAVRYDPAACVHHDPTQQQQLESEMREAVAFVEDVRAGRPREVASRLRARPELVLAPVLRERLLWIAWAGSPVLLAGAALTLILTLTLTLTLTRTPTLTLTLTLT